VSLYGGVEHPVESGVMNAVSVPSRGFFRRVRKHWQLYLIILLPLAYLIIFKYVPMYGVQIAFKNYRVSKGMWGSPWVGLLHFTRFFNSPSSLSIILNTLLVSVYSIVASFPFAVILAVLLNETKSKLFRKSVQMVTYAPYFISTVVMVAILMQVLDTRIGLVNRAIAVFGIHSQNFMGSPGWFRSVYVWSGVWQTTGYSAIIYLAALSAINVELYEAAVVDGAGKLRRILSIDLPGIAPTIVVLLILNMGYVMSVGFEKVYLMQNALNLESSEVISTYVYRVGLLNTDYSFSTAVGLFNSVVNLILLAGVNAIARRVGDVSLW
jgi:putative aldouronate transport system permease protein